MQAIYIYNIGIAVCLIEYLEIFEVQLNMEKYVIWVVILQAILIGYAIKFGYFGEDKTIIEENKQREKQPYRTAFHFQPPKNWMNGTFFYLFFFHCKFCFVLF